MYSKFQNFVTKHHVHSIGLKKISVTWQEAKEFIKKKKAVLIVLCIIKLFYLQEVILWAFKEKKLNKWSCFIEQNLDN